MSQTLLLWSPVTNAYPTCWHSTLCAPSFLAGRDRCGAAVENPAVPFTPFWPVLARMPSGSCQQRNKISRTSKSHGFLSKQFVRKLMEVNTDMYKLWMLFLSRTWIFFCPDDKTFFFFSLLYKENSRWDRDSKTTAVIRECPGALSSWHGREGYYEILFKNSSRILHLFLLILRFIWNVLNVYVLNYAASESSQLVCPVTVD